MLSPTRKSPSVAIWLAMTLLVVIACSFPLIGLARERHVSDQVERVRTELGEHREQEQAERPRAMERLNRIRSELASGGMPEWAGEYSITPGTSPYMCGGDPERTHREGFALAPHSGAVWWYGDHDLPDTTCVDHGDILRVDGSAIIVAWTLNDRTPHTEKYVQWHLLDREIVRISTGEEPVLIPATRMPLLCAAVSEFGTVMAAHAPRKGGAHGSDSLRGVVVPEAWREYVLANPLRAPCEIELLESDPPRWSWQRFPPWRDVTSDEGVKSMFLAFVRCSIPLGTGDGLRVGMPMYLSERVSIPGRVVEVDPTSAHVEFMTLPPPRSERALHSGEQVSTRPIDRD